MKQVIFAKSRTTRQLYKRVPVMLGTGFTSVNDGTEEIFYMTSIDLEELADMGKRAAANKSQKCNDGPIRVIVLERNKLP